MQFDKLVQIYESDVLWERCIAENWLHINETFTLLSTNTYSDLYELKTNNGITFKLDLKYTDTIKVL